MWHGFYLGGCIAAPAFALLIISHSSLTTGNLKFEAGIGLVS